MTRRTAEALIRRLDVNRTLQRAGRPVTSTDLAQTATLLIRARGEDQAVIRG